MTLRITRRLVAALATAGLVLAGAPVASTAAAQAREAVDLTPNISDVSEFSDEFLATLPRNAAEAGFAYAPRLVQVHVPTREDRNRVASSGLDVTEHAGDNFLEVVLDFPEEQASLDTLGVSWKTVTPDLIAQDYERILTDAAFFRSTTVSLVPSGRTTYRVLADFPAEIDALVAGNPDIAKRISVGTSIEGRDLTGIEIGAGVNDPEDGRPVFLMFGNHHAREWPSAETPIEFAYDLVNNFAAGDARTVDLLSRGRVVIVPVSNPDGYDASRTTGAVNFNTIDGGGTVSILATPGNAYKRKNCRLVDGETGTAGCVLIPSPGGMGIGIDLNRNYGGLWGGPGADDSFESATYHGPAPFSEPETQAIRTLISTRQVTTLITNHTFSNLLLRPVGVQPNTIGPDGEPVGFAPDECFTQADGTDNGMQALGERMTAQTGYSNQFGWELYDTTGTTEDYSYNATGGYGYTFEIGPNQFHPPFAEVIDEYLGTSGSASAMTPATATFLTSGEAMSCPGENVQPATAGGGLREAYYIALENAVNTQTHAQLIGNAPAGAEIKVTRSGSFPLWDATPFEDTVTTSMIVGDTGTFTYHVNPSTRPFVATRSYTIDPGIAPTVETTSTQTDTGTALPNMPTDIAIDVPEGTDSIVVQMSAGFLDDYDLSLISPDLITLSSSAEGGSDESVSFARPSGIQPGEYVARVSNFAAATPFTLDTTLGVITDPGLAPELDVIEGVEEQWTVTCTLGGDELASTDVTVGRGETFNMGTFCGAAPAPAPEPAPAPDAEPATDPLPATGAGLALAGLIALGAGSRLRRLG